MFCLVLVPKSYQGNGIDICVPGWMGWPCLSPLDRRWLSCCLYVLVSSEYVLPIQNFASGNSTEALRWWHDVVVPPSRFDAVSGLEWTMLQFPSILWTARTFYSWMRRNCQVSYGTGMTLDRRLILMSESCDLYQCRPFLGVRCIWWSCIELTKYIEIHGLLV